MEIIGIIGIIKRKFFISAKNVVIYKLLEEKMKYVVNE